MNMQNLEKALGGFKGLQIGLFLKDDQFIEGILLDIKPDHLIVEVSQNVFYFALNQIHAISKNAKDFRVSSETTAHLSRSDLHELLKELKYNWVTINSLSRQTFFGMLSKIADDHILLINNEEQLYIQKAFITNIYKGEYQLSEDNQTVDSSDGVSNESETPEESESNGSNLPSSLEIYDDSTEGDSVSSLEADVGEASTNNEALPTYVMSVPSAELLGEETTESEQDYFTGQEAEEEPDTNDVVHAIQEMESQLRKMLNEVITSNKSSENNEPNERQPLVETNKGSMETIEQPTDIQEEQRYEYKNVDPQIILESEYKDDPGYPVNDEEVDKALSFVEEKMDVQKDTYEEADIENSHYSAVENVLVSFPLVSKVGNIGIPTLSPFNNHELFIETRESSSSSSSGDIERLYQEEFEEVVFVLSEPRYSPSFKRKLVDVSPDTNRDQSTVLNDSKESSSYHDHEFDRFQPVYDERFEHHFNRIREESVNNGDVTLIKQAVDRDQAPDLIVHANNEETLESQYYALMKQAERMYLQVRASRLND